MHARPAAVVVAALAAILALAPGLASPRAARANGDPPSDVLPVQDYYTPFQPPLSKSVTNALKTVTANARRAGYPLKVAVVASTSDLGTVPSLIGKPQQYADFLGPEIEFGRKAPLIVVMSNGYGTHDIPPGVAASLQELKAPGGGDALGPGAVDAVVTVARAAGHPIAKPKVAGGSGGSGGTSPAVVFGVPVALLVVVGLVLAARRRAEEQAHGPEAEDPPPP